MAPQATALSTTPFLPAGWLTGSQPLLLRPLLAPLLMGLKGLKGICLDAHLLQRGLILSAAVLEQLPSGLLRAKMATGGPLAPGLLLS